MQGGDESDGDETSHSYPSPSAQRKLSNWDSPPGSPEAAAHAPSHLPAGLSAEPAFCDYAASTPAAAPREAAPATLLQRAASSFRSGQGASASASVSPTGSHASAGSTPSALTLMIRRLQDGKALLSGATPKAAPPAPTQPTASPAVNPSIRLVVKNRPEPIVAAAAPATAKANPVQSAQARQLAARITASSAASELAARSPPASDGYSSLRDPMRRLISPGDGGAQKAAVASAPVAREHATGRSISPRPARVHDSRFVGRELLRSVLAPASTPKPREMSPPPAVRSDSAATASSRLASALARSKSPTLRSPALAVTSARLRSPAAADSAAGVVLAPAPAPTRGHASGEGAGGGQARPSHGSDFLDRMASPRTLGRVEAHEPMSLRTKTFNWTQSLRR